ncbi:ACT domain-containing protein [Phytoactinopolyspora halophila]|uniref:ACT domain-containing protein n=1 Tax=Phytoactinopolyspora halophila TaxID=1981511 RepID=UPI001B8CCC66|nr:ACT domain-containing protein [Phytoactinopolyspora halophila]
MSYLLRVVLPDRPGALGAVASAIGEAGGDIVGVDVVEHRSDGSAVDDLLVDLPTGRLLDSLVTACRSVDDVTVEFIGHYSPGGHLHRDLEAVEAMTTDPKNADTILVDLIPGVFRSGWSLLVSLDGGRVRVERAAGGAPETDGYLAPWMPMGKPTRIVTDAWAPESWTDVVAVGAPLEVPERAIILGRDGGPRILDSELARLSHLADLVTVIRQSTHLQQSSAHGESEGQHAGGTGTA